MSWKIVKIPEVLFFMEGPGVRNTQFTTTGVKLLNVGNINDGLLNLDTTTKFISDKEAYGKYKHFLVEVGDLLIASSGIVVDNFHNKIAWAKAEDLPLCMNTSTIRFKTLDSEILNIRYFSYFLKTRLFTDQLRRLITGSAQLNFGPSHLKQISLPFPPLNIQKRIAEILDAADALKRKDQELLKKYDELAQAIFIDMFGDPVRNEKGWDVKTIEQLAKKTRHSIKRGPFGGALKKEIFVNDGYLVYEQFHALNNDFSFGRYYINEEKYNELIAFDVKPNDIIISCSGIYLGKLAIVPKGAKKGIINQALLKLTLDESVYKNEFFVKVFTQENFKEKYFASERGAAIPNFPPMSAFKEFKFICPPIQIQNEYLEIVNNLKQQIDGIKAQQGKSEALFQTLIQKAFNGELVS